MFRTKVAVWDWIAVAVVLLCAVVLFWQPWASHTKGGCLMISTPQGSEEYSLSVDRELTYTSNGITLTVVIEGGTAYVKESNCPDGVCAASGRISKTGETVICAPAGVRILVKGANEDVDFIAG